MTLADEINKRLKAVLEGLEISSAGDTGRSINKVTKVPDFKIPNIEDKKTETKDIKEDKKLSDTIDTVTSFKEGNVQKIQNLTTAQIGNVTAFARNPFQFVVSSVFRKFTKGAGIAALAVLIFEAVKIIVEELFKPGRAFDTQFRERIDKQVILFLERKEQQELRQGNKQVITTTVAGLRGNALRGNIGGNFYNPDRISTNFLDPRRVESDIISQDARLRSSLGGAANSRARRGR